MYHVTDVLLLGLAKARYIIYYTKPGIKYVYHVTDVLLLGLAKTINHTYI